MMKQFFHFSYFFMIVPVLLMGCKAKETNSIDLSTIHTTALETMAEEFSTSGTPVPNTTTTDVMTTAETTSVEDPVLPSDSPAANVTEAGITDPSPSKNDALAIQTYTENKISIQYPTISYATDTTKDRAINDLLKSNALSILSAHDIDQTVDLVSIKCKVLSVDRNRLTAVYTGSYQTQQAVDPINTMYSNTIDLAKVCSLGFNDYADPYTMAGYLLSDDCEYDQVSKDKAISLNAYKKGNDLEFYTKLLTEADFSSKPAFPSSFSYVNHGTLYFSIPVSHELGDYVIVTYPLDGK